jgi:hypothetical protein
MNNTHYPCSGFAFGEHADDGSLTWIACPNSTGNEAKAFCSVCQLEIDEQTSLEEAERLLEVVLAREWVADLINNDDDLRAVWKDAVPTWLSQVRKQQKQVSKP